MKVKLKLCVLAGKFGGSAVSRFLSMRKVIQVENEKKKHTTTVCFFYDFILVKYENIVYHHLNNHKIYKTSHYKFLLLAYTFLIRMIYIEDADY